MKDNNVTDIENRGICTDVLTAMLKEGAQKLIHQAVSAELEAFMEQHKDRRTKDDKAAVVRNGYLPERKLLTGIGSVNVKIPKVRSKDSKPVIFHSSYVPTYIRKSHSLEASISWLYLKGVSTGEMGEALKVLVGDKALGLSSSTVSRLKQEWSVEYDRWRERSLNKDKWAYIWADGIYSGLRSEDTKLCSLVIVGVNEQGHKHFLAIEDGVRESTQSWREVLLRLKSKGMNAPKLAIGDGALGFWSAIDEVYSDTKHQRCWVHKTANILNKLPKTSQAKAKGHLHEIWQAEHKKDAKK